MDNSDWLITFLSSQSETWNSSSISQVILFYAPLSPKWLLLGSPMLMGPHPSQHHAVWQLQQEETRPKARFKPTSPEKSGVDEGENQVPTYLGQSLSYTFLFQSCSCIWIFSMRTRTELPFTLSWCLWRHQSLRFNSASASHSRKKNSPFNLCTGQPLRHHRSRLIIVTLTMHNWINNSTL